MVCDRTDVKGFHIEQQGFRRRCPVVYSIVRVEKDNYAMFEAMVFYRLYGRERSKCEQVEAANFDAAYAALDHEHFYVFAAQADDKFVGWISAVCIPKIGRTEGRGHLFIDELYTDPGYRRRGIAKSLMRQAEVLARELDTLGLRLYVNTENAEAVAFYEACGYMREGEALFMAKSPPQPAINGGGPLRRLRAAPPLSGEVEMGCLP